MRVLLIGLLAVLAGCGSSAEGGPDGPKVVATTTQLADMARNVAPNAQVTALLKANTDPHEYEVRPADVKALAKADVVLRSGGETDEWLDGALDSAGVSDDKLVNAGAAAGLEGDDPHWWQDPRKAEKAATAIGRGIPGANPGPYVKRLHTLDRAVQACIDAVPADERLLVTSHDALGYYARRYGIRVIGTVIPALTTNGQPSAGEVAALVKTIRQTGVKTIFAESSVNAKIEAAIAREAGVKVGQELWADSLGPEGSDGATYIGSIEANTRALVAGFTGKPASCSFGDA
jgi:zinc/manganese transport system substrate-binding protein/manganese/iron transport system substrate-binding protein